jgi:hypothetical protein
MATAEGMVVVMEEVTEVMGVATEGAEEEAMGVVMVVVIVEEAMGAVSDCPCACASCLCLWF